MKNDEGLKLATSPDDLPEGFVERRQANRLRFENEQRLKLALDGAEMGTWDWDITTDEIQWDDRQFELFGIRPEDFSGQGTQALEAIVPEDRKLVKEAIELSLKRGEAFRVEFRVMHPDGTLRWLAGRGLLLADPPDGIQRMIGVNFDITESKQADMQREEYVRLENRAQMQRLHVAGEFAALLAHQLNQPLTAIRSFAEAGLARLRRGKLEPEQMRETLEEVVAQSDRAATSIRDLRKFLARQPQEMALGDLNAEARAASSLMEVLARGRKVKIKLKLAKTLPLVRMRTSQIEQIIVNLMENAMDAIAYAGNQGGTIEFSTAHDETNNVVLARIVDSGPGLGPDIVGKVFDPLYTTKKNGIGMGLVISRSIIEDHGGHIWAEPGPGGCFAFTLPVSP